MHLRTKFKDLVEKPLSKGILAWLQEHPEVICDQEGDEFVDLKAKEFADDILQSSPGYAAQLLSEIPAHEKNAPDDLVLAESDTMQNKAKQSKYLKCSSCTRHWMEITPYPGGVSRNKGLLSTCSVHKANEEMRIKK